MDNGESDYAFRRADLKSGPVCSLGGEQSETDTQLLLTTFRPFDWKTRKHWTLDLTVALV